MCLGHWYMKACLSKKGVAFDVRADVIRRIPGPEYSPY